MANVGGRVMERHAPVININERYRLASAAPIASSGSSLKLWRMPVFR